MHLIRPEQMGLPASSRSERTGSVPSESDRRTADQSDSEPQPRCESEGATTKLELPATLPVTCKKTADATAQPHPKNGKREVEDKDEKQVNTKKQKTGEVIEEQKNKEEKNSYYSEKEKKPESKKSDPATSCRSLESTDDGSSESSSDRSSDENNHVKDSKSSDDDEEEIEEKVSKTTQECPKTPTTLKGKATSRTIYVRNLSYSVEQADLESLFKDFGEVVDIHLYTDSKGRFRAFGHVEFATAEAALKALELDNTELLRCPIKVSIAMEKGEDAPNESHLSSSVNKGEKFQSQAAFRKDFDKSLGEEKPKTPANPREKNSSSKTICVRNLAYDVERADMENLFNDCGEIVDIRLHTDCEGRFKGFGHVEFATSEAALKALELDSTELLRRPINVCLALEKGEYASNKRSFHKGERFQPQTAFLKDYDKPHLEDKPETSANPRDKSSASSTICFRNLTNRVGQTDIENHFKDCGEIVDGRLGNDCNRRFNGLGHVEFATAEDAQKALQFDNAELRRTMNDGIAQENGEYAPNRSFSNLSSSFNTGEKLQPQTALLKGCGTSFVERKPETREKNAASKTIYVTNLTYGVERADLENLFKGCGDIVDVRLHSDIKGRFKDFGHVEFATSEAAQKALELDNTELLRRPIKVGIAQEKSEYAPNRSFSNLNHSFRKGERFQLQSAFVKGCDTSLLEDKLETPENPKVENAASKSIFVGNLPYGVERADVENLFKGCGEIVDVRLYRDREGRLKGFGHVDFAAAEATQKALKLNKTELLKRPIVVAVAQRNSFQKGEGFQSQNVFVNCSDTSLVEEKPVKESKNSEDHEEETERNASNTPLRSPKIPATLKEKNAASKTIYVTNLSYHVERADVENFFKDCGEIVDVRLHSHRGGRFIGYGHIEFATAEAAQKALELDNTEFLKRPIKIDIAHEKGEYTPNRRSHLSSPFHKDERLRSQTVFVKGFDTSIAEEMLKARLEKHFSSCGEITGISVPKLWDSGALKGFAYLDFKDVDGFKKALHLDQTELGGYPLLVEKAKPRLHNQYIYSGRGDGGYQFGGRDGGGHDGGVGWGRSFGSLRH